MSIQSEVNRISQNIANAYAAAEAKGATMPDAENSDNLAATIRSIESEGGGQIAKLWENASPTSSFAAQTVGLNLAEYDAVSIYYKNKTNGSAFKSTGIVPVGSSVLLDYMTSDALSQRRTATVSADGVTFDGGNSGSTASTACGIPLVIYGYKGIVDVGLEAAKLYEMPNEMTFDGTAGKRIMTNVKLFDTVKDFTILVDATNPDADNYGNGNGTLCQCYMDANNAYYGGFALASAYNWSGSDYGFIVKGVSTDGSAEVFPTIRSAERTKIAVVYKAGIPYKCYYSKASSGSVATLSPSGNFTAVQHEATVSIGGVASDHFDYYKGTIHSLEIYNMVLPENEINKRLAF